MERLIQLLDDVDDLLGPALAFPTPAEWLRGCAAASLLIVLTLTGTPFLLSAAAAAAALPAVGLADRATRRLLAGEASRVTLATANES